MPGAVGTRIFPSTILKSGWNHVGAFCGARHGYFTKGVAFFVQEAIWRTLTEVAPADEFEVAVFGFQWVTSRMA